jgi:hypothetical protein
VFVVSDLVVEMRALNSFEVQELKPSDTAEHLRKSESFSLTNIDAESCAGLLTKITN